jgi:hypothetical protein
MTERSEAARHGYAHRLSLEISPLAAHRREPGPCSSALHASWFLLLRAAGRKSLLAKRSARAFPVAIGGRDKEAAMAEYEARQRALREKTARLRTLRLAREAMSKKVF